MNRLRSIVPAPALLLALIFGAGLAGPALAQASKAGWWLRVDPKKTEATGIVLQLGSSKSDRREWRTWRTGEPVEFDLPADFIQRPQVYLQATAIPDDEDVWFCVFYKDVGVRRFDFDTIEEVTLKQSERDSACR
jgi:hypothetical protein